MFAAKKAILCLSRYFVVNSSPKRKCNSYFRVMKRFLQRISVKEMCVMLILSLSGLIIYGSLNLLYYILPALIKHEITIAKGYLIPTKDNFICLISLVSLTTFSFVLYSYLWTNCRNYSGKVYFKKTLLNNGRYIY